MRSIVRIDASESLLNLFQLSGGVIGRSLGGEISFQGLMKGLKEGGLIGALVHLHMGLDDPQSLRGIHQIVLHRGRILCLGKLTQAAQALNGQTVLRGEVSLMVLHHLRTDLGLHSVMNHIKQCHDKFPPCKKFRRPS